MDLLFKVRDSFTAYLSPPSKRRHTVMPTTPTSKFASMLRPFTPATEPHGQKAKAIIAGRVSKKYLSRSDTKRATTLMRNEKDRVENEEYGDEEQQNDEEEEKEEEDVGENEDDVREDEVGEEEGDETEEESVSDNVSPEESTSQIAGPEDSFSSDADEENESEEDLDSDLDSELSAEAKVHQYLDRQSELARRQETLDKIKQGDWRPEQVSLFQKLSLRGLEPLLPTHWKLDFRTCPEGLFSNKEEETFINAASGNDFRATHALSSLITLGSRVRIIEQCGKPQERLIKKELENYIKWSERDGGYKHLRYLPILCVVAGRTGQELSTVSKIISDQLQFLALKHRQVLAHPPPGHINELGEVEMFSRQPPVLYGVIIMHSITIFVSLDSSKPESELKTLAHFDFADPDMDVWNGFAVSILVCTVRNYLMSIRDEMEVEIVECVEDPDL